MNNILKSKDLVIKLEIEIKKEVSKLKNIPSIVFILVGNDPASHIYVSNKIKACERVNIPSIVFEYPENVTENDLIKRIEFYNNWEEVGGIIIQNPLPKHINTNIIANTIDPKKDVDGFSNYHLGKLFNSPIIYPATPSGIIKWIDYLNYDLEGKKVVIVGRSNTVGKPLALMLLDKNATVTICHSKTKNLYDYTYNADLVIVAVGKPEFLDYTYFSNNTVIIDVGISRTGDNKIKGDVNNDVLVRRDNIILTAVPGGVGPLTVISLLSNLLKLIKCEVF